MTYGAHSYSVKGYGGGEPDVGVSSPTTFDMGTGSSAWVWGSSAASLRAIAALIGISTWVWGSSAASLRAIMPLTGLSEFVFGDNAYLNVPIPPATPPVGSTVAQNLKAIEHVYRVYDPFTLTDGYPDPASTFTETRADWGRYSTEIGGVDITFLRNKLVGIGEINWEEPYDDALVTLEFPMVTNLEAWTGDISMLKDHAEVRIWRILPNGSKDTEPEFEGFISKWGHSKNHLTCQVTGILHQPDLLVRAPALNDLPIEIGAVVPFQWDKNNVPSYIGAACDPITTGITTRDRGQWDQGRLNYVDRQLKRGTLTDGRQYTIKKRYPMKPVMQLKDTTTIHFTLQAGIHGVDTSGLERDTISQVNVFYAKGVDEAGTDWMNSFPNSNGTDVFWQPLSYLDSVHPYDEDGLGGLTLNMGRLDTSIFRIESHVDFGQGWNKVEAKRILDGERARQASDGNDWVGEIILTTDPPQMSRRKIRAGMNFTLEGWHGTDVKFHVSGVTLTDPQGKGTVSLRVDTKARDIDMVQAAIDARTEEIKDPIKPLLINRESTVKKDKVQPWDTTRGDGYIPRKRYFDGVSTFTAPMKKYAVMRFTTGEEETIVKIRIQLTAGTIFHASVCCRCPVAADPTLDYQIAPLGDHQWPSDPLVDGAWLPPKLLNPPDWQIMGWGSFGQAAGYYPGSEVNPVSGVTGVLQVESEWPMSHASIPAGQRSQPTMAWLVIWAHNQPATGWAVLERARRVG